MNTSNERLIHEFGDLLNIPGFREAVIHKIEELKALMGKDIEHYHVIKDVIRPDPVKSPAEGNRFRLDRVESSLWIPSLVPDGEGETGEIESLRIYSIIPQELIQFVVKKQAPPGIIVTEKKLTLPGLPGRVFDIFFETLEKDCISGIVGEEKKTGPTLEEKLFNDIKLSSQQSHIDFKILKSFFDYLLICPELYNHMVNQFQWVWKPLIDRKRSNLEETADTKKNSQSFF